MRDSRVDGVRHVEPITATPSPASTHGDDGDNRIPTSGTRVCGLMEKEKDLLLSPKLRRSRRQRPRRCRGGALPQAGPRIPAAAAVLSGRECVLHSTANENIRDQ